MINLASLRSSVGVRIFIIGFLVLALMIPALMVMGLIAERENRHDSVVREVSQKWGSTQYVTGPVLTLPFKKYYKNDKGELKYTVSYAHILPETLHYNAEMKPNIRYRGIYEVVLYNADITMTGHFDLSALRELNIPRKNVIWAKASLSTGVKDMKGIKNTVTIELAGKALSPDPGITDNDALSSGISARLTFPSSTDRHEFNVKMNLNGSRQLFFAPLGRVTTAEARSTWSTPSFTGEFLPETREISDDGFTGSWKVLHLNRNYPQQWTGPRRNLDLLDTSAFGVKLLMPVDEYQQTMRTAKYAIMFISLTFLAFFMIEVLTRRDIHPVQYLLVGFALVLFYTLLLSFSEHIPFCYAYLIASASVVAMITAYTRSILADIRLTGLVAGILALLYGLLYIILRQEDYALLIGSLMLFVILAVIMFITRKIDWYNALKPGADGTQ